MPANARVTPAPYQEVATIHYDGIRVVVAVQGRDVIVATRKLSRFKAEQLCAGLITALKLAQENEEAGRYDEPPAR